MSFTQEFNELELGAITQFDFIAYSIKDIKRALAFLDSDLEGESPILASLSLTEAQNSINYMITQLNTLTDEEKAMAGNLNNAIDQVNKFVSNLEEVVKIKIHDREEAKNKEVKIDNQRAETQPQEEKIANQRTEEDTWEKAQYYISSIQRAIIEEKLKALPNIMYQRKKQGYDEFQSMLSELQKLCEKTLTEEQEYPVNQKILLFVNQGEQILAHYSDQIKSIRAKLLDNDRSLYLSAIRMYVNAIRILVDFFKCFLSHFFDISPTTSQTKEIEARASLDKALDEVKNYMSAQNTDLKNLLQEIKNNTDGNESDIGPHNR